MVKQKAMLKKQTRKELDTQASHNSDNSNDNHVAETEVSKKRTISNEGLLEPMNKKTRTQSSKKPEDEFTETSGRAQFIKDDNTVVIEVKEKEKADFPSEDESADGSEDDKQSDAQNDDGCLATISTSESHSEEGDLDGNDQSHRETNVNEFKKGSKRSFEDMEDKIDNLSATLQAMQKLMVKKGFLSDSEDSIDDSDDERKSNKKRRHKSKGKSKSNTPQKRKSKGRGEVNEGSLSDTKIYHNAVEKAIEKELEHQEIGNPDITFKKWDGSSLEDHFVDTCDEMLDVENFIAGFKAAVAVGRSYDDRNRET